MEREIAAIPVCRVEGLGSSALNPRAIPVAESNFVMLNNFRLTSETVVQWNQKSLHFLCVGFRF